MNEIVDKFLLAGNKFMPEIQGFTYSACGPFNKTKKKHKNLKKQEIHNTYLSKRTR